MQITEAVWTTVALVGCGFSLWAALDGLFDYREICHAIESHRAVYRGPRWWIALGNLVSSCAWALVWVGFAGIGLAVISRHFVEYAGPALVVVVLLMLGIQLWNRYARHKLDVAVTRGAA
jgi:hypothetical protein